MKQHIHLLPSVTFHAPFWQDLAQSLTTDHCWNCCTSDCQPRCRSLPGQLLCMCASFAQERVHSCLRKPERVHSCLQGTPWAAWWPCCACGITTKQGCNQPPPTSAGHSLGGAVALLCMLRLLHSSSLPPGAAGLRCICFGTPAVGDAALAAAVADAGWQDHILFYTLAGEGGLIVIQRMPLRGSHGQTCSILCRSSCMLLRPCAHTSCRGGPRFVQPRQGCQQAV